MHRVIRQGAPQARQVADRFHLLQNVPLERTEGEARKLAEDFGCDDYPDKFPAGPEVAGFVEGARSIECQTCKSQCENDSVQDLRNCDLKNRID